jgi:hypothetical protein
MQNESAIFKIAEVREKFSPKQVAFYLLEVKEWFDKVNGNTYFASQATITLKNGKTKTYTLPFQYGYGSHSEHETFEEVLKDLKGNIDIREYSWSCFLSDIDYRYRVVKTSVLKRDCHF